MSLGHVRWRGRRALRVSLLTAAFGAAWASNAAANTVLHVDAARGADTGNCQLTACRTLAYAIDQGRSVPDVVTVQAAAGSYNGDLNLGAGDSGLTITGAGSATNPATSTI